MRDLDHQSLRERIDGLQPVYALGVALEAYDNLRADIRADILDVVHATGLQGVPALMLLSRGATGVSVSVDQNERGRHA